MSFLSWITNNYQFFKLEIKMKKLFSISLMLSLFVIVAVSSALSMYFVGEVTADFIVSGFAVAVLFAMTPKKVALFETIPVDQVRAAITNSLVDIYRENVPVKTFLSSFFPERTSNTKFISIEVQRSNQKLAVDILRGTGSNKNQVTRSTIKTFLPPFYSEEYNVNELEIYDVAYNTLDVGAMRQLASEQADMVSKITDKIDRSYEKQRADVLQTGIVELSEHESIDFRRKASSIVNDNTQYFDTPTNDPGDVFQRAGDFLREQGKISLGAGERIVCIFGKKALNDLLNNPIFIDKYDKLHMKVGDVVPAEMSTAGATYHGYISVGSYIYDLWAYPEYFTNGSGNIEYYINDRNMIATIYRPNFKFVYGMVPQLPGVVVPMTVKQGFYTLEYVDAKQMNHAQKIMSAGVAVPTAIDQIYTQTVTGA